MLGYIQRLSQELEELVMEGLEVLQPIFAKLSSGMNCSFSACWRGRLF